MNILKDPPKGIHTRRIDKVGDTQQILLQIDESGSRANEYINVYARNTNPMVGVSYNNYGNSQSSGNKQASLPYKVENVRPPILSPYDLQPLSRLPRTWFYASSNPEFPNIVQDLKCDNLSKHLQKDHRSGSNLFPDSNKNFNIQYSDNNNQSVSKIKNKSLLEYDVNTNKISNNKKNIIVDDIDKKAIRKIIHNINMNSNKTIQSNPQIIQSFKKIQNQKKIQSLPSHLNKISKYQKQNLPDVLDSKYINKNYKNRKIPFISNKK